MNFFAKHRTIFSITIAVLVLTVAAGAIFWARGFKPDFKKGIERTGLLVITSTPTGASVFLDGRLTAATDTNIAYLDPKTYKVRIEKEGYSAWEKDVGVVADLATEIKALLFPVAPAIKPLTTSGAQNPALSPDGTKIVYAATGENGGLFLFPMSDRPFPFRQGPRLLVKNQNNFDFSKAAFIWGPDSKELIAQFRDEEDKTVANILIDSDKKDQPPTDITASLNATISGWQAEIGQRAQTLALLAPDELKAATAEAKPEKQSLSKEPQKTPTLGLPGIQTGLINYFPTGLVFSPDEEKIVYKNKDGKYKIFDIKDKKESTLPEFINLIGISWYPDSGHLVVAEENKLSIIETDGLNKMTVYSGNFVDGFVFANPAGSGLIILTTLTQGEGTPANLYEIDLR
ncbi:hypothetical protein A2W15_06160 [Candidatus Woesebacteria bacterium RBG_16_41_13]|nr:MAG: hypothetical protein A2W15_06160 [Candidatus Woesebacteria bacterium RBG_16_41_13]